MTPKSGKSDCVVLIPIYQSCLSASECLSLEQCCKILMHYPRCLVAPTGLDLINFLKIASDLKVEFFDPEYFKGFCGYNKLLLSLEFYERFSSYSFVLIHQLDAFVFRDDLAGWCDSGYDYIGAPWFPGYSEKFDGNPASCAGNGGLSLRSVSAALNILNKWQILKRPKKILQDYNNYYWQGWLLRFPKIFLRMFGYQNNSKFFLKHYRANEDIFWAQIAPNWQSNFRVPDPDTAARFAVECDPQYWYRRHGKLPFGCHAWLRYDPEFWSNFIPINSSDSFEDHKSTG